ncbi:MAG: hypothetical protein R6W06_15295, partial [Prochlorococcaceae cyanobacterium]
MAKCPPAAIRRRQALFSMEIYTSRGLQLQNPGHHLLPAQGPAAVLHCYRGLLAAAFLTICGGARAAQAARCAPPPLHSPQGRSASSAAPAMAPHILLIDRGESVVSGALISWPRIRSVIAHQWEMSAEMLIWLCHCPPEALTISRLGPIHIAHGGSWAQSQELESLRWGYLDRPLIHGKAVGIRPDPCNGGWRALSSWEASNAQRVLSEHGSPITQRSCRIWERFGWQWMG